MIIKTHPQINDSLYYLNKCIHHHCSQSCRHSSSCLLYWSSRHLDHTGHHQYCTRPHLDTDTYTVRHITETTCSWHTSTVYTISSKAFLTITFKASHSVITSGIVMAVVQGHIGTFINICVSQHASWQMCHYSGRYLTLAVKTITRKPFITSAIVLSNSIHTCRVVVTFIQVFTGTLIEV